MSLCLVRESGERLAEQGVQACDEDERTDGDGGQAGEQHGGGGDVETGPDTFARRFIEAAKERLDRAVEHLRREHTADAAEEQTPLHKIAVQDDGCGENEAGEEEVNEEARMPADAELDSAKRIAELGTPG